MIEINGISIDPEQQAPALARANLLSADSSSSNYILIQTNQPLNRQQKSELASLDVEILEYVPDSTYICHYSPADLSPIRALPYVVWTNIYLKGFKIPPALQAVPSAAKVTNLLDGLATARSMSQDMMKVEVVLQEDASAADVRDEIAAAARLDPTVLEVSNKKVRLVVQSRYLADLAAIDEVRHIEEYKPKQLHNNIALRIMKADVTHSRTNLEGSGQVVAVADTGFDKGSITDVHPAFSNRVLKLYSLGRPNKPNDPNGHGTHVAGSILGDGISSILGGSIRGSAPKAKLVFQSVLDANGGLGGIPVDLNDLFLPPYQNDGARVHSNSWGVPGSNGRYSANSREVDDFVWNHRDFVVCFSAGNDGTDQNRDGVIDAGSVSDPGTAKNCITVGASENDRPSFQFSGGINKYGQAWPGDFPAEPIASDLVATNPEGMVAFSSRGPTRDRRIAPDVVAPGSAILSTRSRDVIGSAGWAKSDDPLYFFEGGTSMSNPLVAGCAAVTREYLQAQGIAKPSAALIKAMLINGAADMVGQYIPSEAGTIPSNSEGFGRVDLARTVNAVSQDEEVEFWDEDISLETGEEKTVVVSVASTTPMLKVTLVWTDLPGETLQNDLDLIVRAANGQERHGNMAVASLEFDRINNIEQISWDNVPAGDVEIVVRAFRTVLHPQSYALVVRTKTNREDEIFSKISTSGLTVPDNSPAGVSSTVAFTEQSTISSIKVSVDIAHTYIGDLVVTLTAPSGTAVVLHDRSGGPADNIKQTFDLASTPALNNLIGQSLQGNWTLQIQDLANRDVGKLNRWELEIKGQ